MIVDEGIHFFKFWLDIGQEMQLKRFHDRRHSPLTNWKFSPMDVAGMGKWDDYTKARDLMIEKTHTGMRRGSSSRPTTSAGRGSPSSRHLLQTLPYAGRDLDEIGKQDGKIIGEGMKFLTE